MEDSEPVKMATLKKAYAEIILNTSKEAAARIMAADRKALSYQKELFVVKEDAIRMLVHLKQLLDSKTAEAEVRTENQQKKIDELEAQLSEAEGIIVDLREELSLSQDKLERIKCSQMQPLKLQASVYQDEQPPNPPCKNELIGRTDDGGYHAPQYPPTERACATKYPAEMLLQYPSWSQLTLFARGQSASHVRPSILSGCKTSLKSFDEVKSNKERDSPCCSESDEKDLEIDFAGLEAKSLEHESCHGQSSRDGVRRTRKNVKYQEAIAVLCKSNRGRGAKSYQPPSLIKCRTYAGKQNEASREVHAKDDSALESNVSISSYEMNHSIAPEEISKEFPDNPDFRETEAEKESDLSCDVDPIRLDTSLADCNLHDVQIAKESEGVPIGLKFTFQRKRKREVLTKLDNNITSEISNVVSLPLLEQGDAAKQQKAISKEEQSKDGCHILQVAQQLISLSGNGHA